MQSTMDKTDICATSSSSSSSSSSSYERNEGRMKSCVTVSRRRLGNMRPILLAISCSVFLLMLRLRVPTAAAFQQRRLQLGGNRWTATTERIARVRSNGSSDNNNSNSNINNEGDSAGTKKDMNIVTKSSWYAVELFGKAFGRSKDKSDKAADNDALNAVVIDTDKPPGSLPETIQRIEDDNDRSYFLSGDMDTQLYDPNCYFADPFVGFSGRDRFVDNLKNLGSFITEYDARVLPPKKEASGAAAAAGSSSSTTSTNSAATTVQTRLMVKLRLNLPWKPVLAWPWGVTYTIDPDTFLITEHIESWEIEPLEGVKMIFRTSPLKL